MSDWNDVGTEIGDAWLASIFPNKDASKRAQWLAKLRDAEFDTTNELAALDEAGWDELGLPLAIRKGLQGALQPASGGAEDGMVRSTLASLSKAKLEDRPVQQIDMVVMDVSGSMRSRSTVDKDKTREDVSKVLFHTLVDRMISLELDHACGLLSFGSEITPIGITRAYESFHDELGRLDATQGRTMLYDAIFAAAVEIESFNANHCDGKVKQRRIFVLTDGADNASTKAAWAVAQFLQQRGIVLDAIPVGGPNAVLQSMCTATGGLCFDAVSQEQAVGLFEREAVLHIALRESQDPPPPINDMASLHQLESAAQVCTTVACSVPKSVFAPTMKAETAATKMATASGATKRVLKEYADFCKSPPSGWQAFINADDVFQWKLTFAPPNEPYNGGTFLVSVSFPSTYPFDAPRVRFVTPIYHCNINSDGHICLDVLKDSWSPALTMSKIAHCIASLLRDPNGMDPLDAFKGQLLRDDPAAFMREARLHTDAHASLSLVELCQKYNIS